MGATKGDTRSLDYGSLKGITMRTPNREPQEYSRHIMEYKDPGRYILIIFLLYSWGSLFGVPILVPLPLARDFPRGV